MNKPRTTALLNALISEAQLRDIFNDARRVFPGMPNLSDRAYSRLSDEIRRLIHRQNNASLPADEQKDVCPADIRSERFMEVRRLANELLVALEAFAEFDGSETWRKPIRSGGASYGELEDVLQRLDIPGIARPPAKAPRGQPRKSWHLWGRSVARLVEEALREAGYSGILTRTDADSVTAFLGAEIIGLIAGPIQPHTFSSAMGGADRDRKKNRDPRAIDYLMETGDKRLVHKL